ncbi:unnamed protein product [Rangifer tarandus platyrhynchus]|uniref:G-protein coupled receptors family 1 profile domain-containing protein n=1 Tax=Rangifer tarandus platyrhynchus TaxID=3082113 RepID=A0ABN8XVW6_RANTA|nr:unnamed protein product [Rangifer tarandus platyrhynchus]
MTGCNASQGHPSFFLLQGIPGMEDKHKWISIPFSSMYFVTILGNCTILFTISTERSLHKPMFLLLGMLALTDLGMSTTTIPKVLCIFWFDQSDISFEGCLVQLFFLHSISALQSAILMSMAFDRYVAICEPLRYATILSNSRIGLIGLVSLVRAVLLILPMPILLQQMPFHARHRLTFCHMVIPHTYCDHMAVVKLACDDTRPNRIYGLFVILLVVGLDLVLIGFSYGLILQAVRRLNSRDAICKALNTCSAHLFVILITYVPALFSSLTHRLGHNIPPHVHILLANLYLLLPSVFNPIIYGMKTKDIQIKVAKCLCRRHS